MNQSNPYARPQPPVSPRPGKPVGYHDDVKPHPRTVQSQPWLLGSLALVALTLIPQNLWSRLSAPLSLQTRQSQTVPPDAGQSWSLNRTKPAKTCQVMLNADQRLSRSQLNQFLSVSQNSSQTNVHEAIASPYCTLSKAHQTYQSEAYPLAFDPDTWFVINYEQGLYKSYDFVFQK